MGVTFWIFLITQISQVVSFFGTPKKVDETLWSVSFHNNLYLTHASAEDRTKKHEVEEMSMAQLGPEDDWYDMALITLAAADCTASTEETPAKMTWGTTGWRRMLVMTRLLIECERPAGRRTIDERWTAAARNAILKEAPWLTGVRMADDRRFPYSAEHANGRNCTAVKFAKRIMWVEMALRLWAVVGTGEVDGGDFH